MSASDRFACPCCGCLTLPQEPPGTYEVCPVCWWEDDGVQFEHPDRRGGANAPSLNEARANYLHFGASDEDLIDAVRPPRPEEAPPDEAGKSSCS